MYFIFEMFQFFCSNLVHDVNIWRVDGEYCSLYSYITAHIPACSLVASNFVENIIFHKDSRERIISFEYANDILDPSSEACKAPIEKKSKIKSRGVLSSFEVTKLPVAIEGNLFYKAPPGSTQNGAGDKKQTQQAEPSFFQKYKWYLIIGFIVYMVISVVNNPELQKQMQEAKAAQS